MIVVMKAVEMVMVIVDFNGDNRDSAMVVKVR